MPAVPLLTDHPVLLLVLAVAGAACGAWCAAWQRHARVPVLPAKRRPAGKAVRPWPLAGPLTYGSASERREGFRRKGGRVRGRLADAGATAALGTGWVVDRSAGGLCLQVARRLAEGAMLSVRPVHAPARMPWVQVEVKSCREWTGGWEVGCRFVRRPSWDMLLHFG
jgi:hypothetical protein